MRGIMKISVKQHANCIIEVDEVNVIKGSKFNWCASHQVIGIRPLAPVQNSVSLKLMQRKTLNLVLNLPDVENITK